MSRKQPIPFDFAESFNTRTDLEGLRPGDDPCLVHFFIPLSQPLGLPEGADVLTISHIGTADGRVVEVTQHVLGKGWKLRYAAPLA